MSVKGLFGAVYDGWSCRGLSQTYSERAILDCGEEGVRASIIACGDAPPVLYPAEHVLDAVSLFIEGLVEGGWILPVLAWWNAGRNSLVFQAIAKPVGIIATIGKQFLGAGQTLEQLPRAVVVADLARR